MTILPVAPETLIACLWYSAKNVATRKPGFIEQGRPSLSPIEGHIGYRIFNIPCFPGGLVAHLMLSTKNIIAMQFQTFSWFNKKSKRLVCIHSLLALLDDTHEKGHS